MASTKQKTRRTSRGFQRSLENLTESMNCVEKPFLRLGLPVYRAGDTVQVHVRIREGEKERIQIFEGVVIKKKNAGVGRSFTVRKISHGVGVERIFLESSPRVAKIDVIQQGKVRRAKLYYLRGLVGKAARIARLGE